MQCAFYASIIFLPLFISIADVVLCSGPMTNNATSARPNTLNDDADDIQKQLDNETRDRLMNGKVKSVFLIHFPFTTPMPKYVRVLGSQRVSEEELGRRRRKMRGTDDAQTTTPYLDLPYLKWTYEAPDDLNRLSFMGNLSIVPDSLKWNYQDQENWVTTDKACGGHAQSPISLPTKGLLDSKTGRPLRFYNFYVKPNATEINNDGQVLRITNQYGNGTVRPTIEGGAATNRRYRFHSLVLRFPSEHVVSHMHYPLETQSLYVAAGYDYDAALVATEKDPLAFMTVSSLYVIANHTQPGLRRLAEAVAATPMRQLEPLALGDIDPEFAEYACYEGSLTTPPCSESVVWLVRGRTLPVTRDVLEQLKGYFKNCFSAGIFSFRQTQPRNDRPVYYFH